MMLLAMIMMMTLMNQQYPTTEQQRNAGSDAATNARERNAQRNVQLERGKHTDISTLMWSGRGAPSS
eukprot:1679515-Lingulodinium_polyedra.AAC.1